MGGELIRLGTPAVLFLGLFKSSADVLRRRSSLVRFPHMAQYSAGLKSRSGTDSFSMRHITLSSQALLPFRSLCQFSLSLSSLFPLSVPCPLCLCLSVFFSFSLLCLSFLFLFPCSSHPLCCPPSRSSLFFSFTGLLV